MIPVIGIPYLVGRPLLVRLLDTIDHDVNRVILIDNSETNELAGLSNRTVTVVSTRHNLGVAASWNLILKSEPLAPYWVIANADLEFAPGDLARIDETMSSFDGLALIDGFACFALSHSAVERIGFFDENFVPAYYEDNDYSWRQRLAGVEAINIPHHIIHHGSMVIRTEPRYRSANGVTFPENGRYYAAKWGGLPGEEKYKTPFNTGADPRFWFLDFQRLAALTWR